MGKAYLDTWIQINKPWITNLRGDWPWRFYVVILSLRLFDSLSTVNKSTNQLRLSIWFIGILVTNLVSSVENPLRLLVKQPVVNSIQLANSRPTTKSTNNKPPSQVLYKTTCVHQKKNTHTKKKTVSSLSSGESFYPPTKPPWVVSLSEPHRMLHGRMSI